jgi:hypothetical protein
MGPLVICPSGELISAPRRPLLDLTAACSTPIKVYAVICIEKQSTLNLSVMNCYSNIYADNEIPD